MGFRMPPFLVKRNIFVYTVPIGILLIISVSKYFEETTNDRLQHVRQKSQVYYAGSPVTAVSLISEMTTRNTSETVHKIPTDLRQNARGPRTVRRHSQQRVNSSNFSLDPDIDTKIEELNFKKPELLDTFKNPCWFEDLPKGNLYTNNIYPKIWRPEKVIGGDPFPGLRRIFRNRTQRLRCLPYFYIPGVSKCGTMDLFDSLSQHPQIITPPMKEPVFWNRVRYNEPQPHIGIQFRKNLMKIHGVPIPRKIAHYLDLYDSVSEKIRQHTDDGVNNFITGDFSPSYMYDFDGWYKMRANRPQNSEPRYVISDIIHRLTPDAKIIIILRNPIDRLFSDYRYFKGLPGQRRSSLDFHGVALKAIYNFNQCLSDHSLRWCLYNEKMDINTTPIRLRVGIYQPYIADWLKVFPRENVLITRLEDYTRHKEKILRNIHNFLGLDPVPYIENSSKVVNKNNYYEGNMLAKTRKMLSEFYSPYNKRLADFLQNNKYKWNL